MSFIGQVQRMSSVETELTEVSTLSMDNKLFSSDWLQKFPKLEKINIQSCSSIDLVFDMQGYSHLDGEVFPRLEEINLVYLVKLTHIWSKTIHCIQCFQSLRSLKISCCFSLRHVFTPTIVRAISKLEKLKLRQCSLLEELVSDNEDDGACSYPYELKFPSLRKLEISACPKLDISFLLNVYKKQWNLSLPSYSTTSDTRSSIFEENYSRSYGSHLGCTPLCSKLIPQSKIDKKKNKV